jgi:hypothetical protein
MSVSEIFFFYFFFLFPSVYLATHVSHFLPLFLSLPLSPHLTLLLPYIHPPSPSKIPSIGTIRDFFLLLFSKSQLESECIIMSLIYIERLMKETRGKLCIRPNNWKAMYVEQRCTVHINIFVVTFFSSIFCLFTYLFMCKYFIYLFYSSCV